jgi:hypothetical protein
LRVKHDATDDAAIGVKDLEADNFSLKINADSEKITKFNPLSTNRLAADSEYRSTFALREVKTSRRDHRIWHEY